MLRWSIIILLFISSTVYAQDSLKSRRWNLQLGISSGNVQDNIQLWGTHVLFRNNQVQPVLTTTIKASQFVGVDVGLDCDFLAHEKEHPKSYFAAGIYCNILFFQLDAKITDLTIPGHFPQIHRYDTHEFTQEACRYSLSVPLVHYIRMERVNVINRLGIAYTNFFNDKLPCRYREIYTGSMWHDVTENMELNSALSLFYNLNIAYRFKDFAPFMYGEISTLNNSISFHGNEYKPGLLWRLGLGLSFQF